MVYISAVYASTAYLVRRKLWSKLTDLQATYSGPWCFVGDFNSILGAHEARGSHLPLRVACDDFQEFRNSARLTHILTRGSTFTWCNGWRGLARTEKRLDRSLCNDHWIDFWESTACCTLPRSRSDHHPLVIVSKRGNDAIHSHFKFQKMWLQHPNCQRVVKEVWNRPAVGCPMSIVSQKLKALKAELKSWNMMVFGNVHNRVRTASELVDNIQQQIDLFGPSEILLDREAEAHIELKQALSYEEEIWRAKSRLNWYCHGDRNTKFFHQMTKIRNGTQKMAVLRDGELIIDDHDGIAQHVLNFYTNLYASPNNCVPNDLISRVVPSLVTDAENDILTAIPSTEEIKLAVFSMNGDGAPGSDGFAGCFYQLFWDVIGQDVCSAVSQFFAQGWLPPNLNSNLVALIPKVKGTDRIEDFRPIALANFQFKVITKVLADRLAAIASRIISPQQRGFVRGRHIQDCICIASEAANLLDYKTFGGNLALKLDIKKAFDTIDWDFLLSVLQAFGFNSKFRKWINVILHSAKLSFSVNGKSVGYLACQRGVRQGDPLSALLFCITEEVLSRGISDLVRRGALSPITGPNGFQSPNHVMYADDVLVLCKGTKKNLEALMSLFRRYSSASGQHLSLNKCRFYSGNISATNSALIASQLGFSAGHLPFNYLGVPIFKGKPRRIHLQPIADKIIAKLAGWKGSLLSIMGRVELVKSVIQGMLLYSFQVYVWPSALLKQLDQCLKNFIWVGDVHTRKVVTVAWHRVCVPLVEGGLGIKPLKVLNDSALLRLTWEVMASTSECALFLKERFFRHKKPAANYVKSSLWLGLKLHLNTVQANSSWHIGDGRNIHFWLDKWLDVPLVERLHFPAHTHNELCATVADFIQDNDWQIPPVFQLLFPAVVADMKRVVIPKFEAKDQLIWNGTCSGKLSFKEARSFLNPANQNVPWAKLIWKQSIPPSKSFIAWRLLHNRMPTDECLRQVGCITVSVCSLCYCAAETTQHLFLECPFATRLWEWMSSLIHRPLDRSYL